ncbi:MAG: FHA domain-containing protein [Polyangiaceae bacterium]
MTLCAAGHPSDEPDYCSVCGLAMAGAARSNVAAPGACPKCSEVRADPEARFCEVCRYDFVGKKQGPGPSVVTPLPAIVRPSPNPGAGPAVTWALVITIDPALDTDPDPQSPCPTNVAPERLLVDEDELLIGRQDDRRDIDPDVALSDPGASRRHAKILRRDGALVLQDLASTNGTHVNGEEMVAGSRRALSAGDAVTLGRWTRIVVERKP